jgi:ATP-binding protein involved in chromosome partitioning
MQDSTPSPEVVQKILDKFPEPETGRSLVQTGQVYQVDYSGDYLRVKIGLTRFVAPIREKIREQLREHLRQHLASAREIEVEIAEHHRPAEKLGPVGLAAKAVVAVGAGKGGVGKSTVAVLLAWGLKQAGARVGLLDADVFGPSLPHLLGAHEQPFIEGGKIQPTFVAGVPLMSMGLLVPPGEAVIWRGPMLHNALLQFLKDTNWGELDYLVVDLPPGTGDAALSLSQLIPLTGAVIVCTPQELALLDAVKAVAMFRRVNVDVLGMIENMSHFVCPVCKSRHEIFGSGGARAKARELGLEFLGEIPINLQIRISGDRGQITACLEDPVIRPYIDSMCERFVETIVERRRRRPVLPELTVLK